MNKKLSFFLIASFAIILNNGLAQTGIQRNTIPAKPFFNFNGDSEPAMVLPGIVSTGSMETNGTFSPDGKEFFYSTEFLHVGSTIIYMKFESGQWSLPEIASFSGKHRDIDPMFSPDGKRVYFTSRRPLHDTLSHQDDANIWYVEKNSRGYGEPIQVGVGINTDQNQFNNSVSNDRTIFFHANDDASNSSDIFKASWQEGKYVVEPLDPSINTSHGEFDPFISPDESYIIFSSDRPEGLGGTDLYISFATGDSWTTPQNLGTPINSSANDYSAIINGRIMTFTSGRFLEPWSEKNKENYQTLISKIHGPDNGLNNIWWVNIDFIEKMRITANNKK